MTDRDPTARALLPQVHTNGTRRGALLAGGVKGNSEVTAVLQRIYAEPDANEPREDRG